MLDKDLFRLIDDKKNIAFSVILSVASLIINLGITAAICAALYYVYSGFSYKKCVVLLVCAASGIAVRTILSLVNGRIKNNLGAQIKKDLRERTYKKIADYGVNSIDDMNVAGLTQISIEGIEQLDLYYSSYLPQFFYSMIAPFVLFTVCVFLDWRTALVLLACVPLIPISIVAVSKYAKKIFAKYWGKYITMGDSFLDSIQGMKELKIFQMDGAYNERMNKKAEEFRKITMKVLVMQLASTTIMDLVAFGGAGAGIAITIWGVAARGVSPFAGLFLILTAVEFFLPLRSLGSAFHVAMNGASAGKKIYKLLNAPLPVWGDKKLQGARVELKDVCFSYDGKREILKDVNMTFDKGMTAIAGESGSGKSTIAGLITGALKSGKGSVEIGGTQISSLDRQDYYAHLCLVSGNIYIFNESVRDNFLLVCPDATDEEMWRALEKVNLDKFVKQSGGLDKIVNEGGENISGGQKQRLALAVNLVSDKSLYVFDEATSNIDAESEAVIMKNISQLAQEKTVVVISHRLANIREADNIYYLSHGRITEQGNHSTLMEKDGEYKRLCVMQKNLEEGYITEAGQ